MTENEYQQKISALEKKVENQRINIQALELLQAKNRNIIASLRKAMPDADYFSCVKHDVQKMQEVLQWMNSHIQNWESTVERMVGNDRGHENRSESSC